MISIVVPVYNIEKTISRCIDSILVQTYNDFELILVDDGSTDHSLTICEKYARSDTRIKVISKDNGGVSSARNAGINAASGDYLVFIDGDDFISSDYLEKVCLLDEDLTIASVYYASPNGEATKIARQEKDATEVVSPSNIGKWFDKGSLYSAWTSMFKRSIINDYSIYFDTNTTRGEDTIFMINYVARCNKVRFISKIVYYYVQYGKEGSSSSKLNKKNVCALDYLDRFLSSWLIKNGITSKVFFSSEHWIKYELKEYLFTIIRSNSLSLKEKYSYFKLMLSLPSYDSQSLVFAKSKLFVRFIMKFKSPLLLCACSSVYSCYGIIKKILFIAKEKIK